MTLFLHGKNAPKFNLFSDTFAIRFWGVFRPCLDPVGPVRKTPIFGEKRPKNSPEKAVNICIRGKQILRIRAKPTFKKCEIYTIKIRKK